MQQLRYAEDLKAFAEVPIDDAEISDAELELAVQLVEQSASKAFEPGGYGDEVRKQVWDMIEQKIRGEEIVAPPDEEPKAQIIDLMEALKASLGYDAEQETEKRKPPKRSPRRAATSKKAAGARKRAAKKK